jgi:hypothetical protein
MARNTPKSEPPRDETGGATSTPKPRPRAPRARRPAGSARADAAGVPAVPEDTFTTRSVSAGDRPSASRVTGPTSSAWEPSPDDIRTRAYHLFLERGGGHGRDFEDWLLAERELRQRHLSH